MVSEMADRSDYSDEYLERLRDYYVDHDISLEDVAYLSSTEFGQPIPFENLRKIAAAGRWTTIKRRKAYGKDGLPADIVEEVEDLRQIVYDTILNPEETHAPRDLASLISAYSNLKGISREGGSSAKTDLQAVLDSLEENK